MIADHSRALVATHNLTRKCFRRTRDFLLLTSDEGVVSGLVSVFQADSRGVAVTPRPPSDRIVLGPDSSRAAVEALLGEARSSIRILDHKLSDAGIHAILRDRRRRGVGVEIESGRGAGGLRPHGRLILIDGALAVLGSFALSAASLDSRREVAVIVRRPELVAKLERHFDKMVSHPLKQMDAAA
jgi:phosphatidylserine/phosphatidylglycerophosphate/cardiolipin synthase-like enzyme